MRESRKPPSFWKERSPESSDILRAFIICYACSGYTQALSSLQSVSGHAQALSSSQSFSGHAQAPSSLQSVSGHAQTLSSMLSVVSLIHITHRFYQLTVYLYLMRGNSGLWVLWYEKMLIFSIFLACHYLLQFEKCNFTVPNRNRGVVMVAVVQYWRSFVKEVDILMRKRKKEYADTYTKREPA